MANILYDGVRITDESRTDGILTFSEVPNILEVQEDVYGDKGQLKLVVNSGFSIVVTADSQFYITLFDETINNVLSPTQANNKRFYVFPQAQGNAASNTAMSIAKALRSCPSLSADFVITTATTNSSGDSVLVTARTIGKRYFATNLVTNIASGYVESVIVNDGSADASNSNLLFNDGFFNSKIDVEVYQGEDYITTLEKNWYGNKCAFNMTPVLATMTQPTCELNNEPILPYTLVISRLAENGSYTNLGQVSGRTTYGYEANVSERYKALGVQLLSNNLINDKANVLYTYGAEIPFSVLCRASNTPSGGFSIKYTIYDSSYTQIYTYTDMISTPWGDAFIKDMSFTIPSYITSATYVEIELANNKLRYQLIKPLKTSDGYQRVMWRNEYGGISFFDFCGARSLSDNLDVETYEKNIFGYYNVDAYGKPTYELKKIYSSSLSKTWKMKTHLMEQGGAYIFNSMMKSKMVWTVLDGRNVVLIPKSIEVAEDGSYDNIYTATVQFDFSQEAYG